MQYGIYGATDRGFILRERASNPSEAEEVRVDYADRFPNEVTAVASTVNDLPDVVNGSIFSDRRFEDVSVYNPMHTSRGAMRLAR